MDNKKIIIISSVFILIALMAPAIFLFFPKTNKKITCINNQVSKPLLLVNNGSRDKKEIAITFDADMTNWMEKELISCKVNSFCNKNILKILEENNTPATFFLTGLWTEEYPNQAKEIANNKLFEIGNHSFDHPAFEIPCFTLKKVKDKQDEIIKAQDIIKNITGVTPKFFRFPGGCFSKEDTNLVHKLGLATVGWDVVSGDSYLKSNNQIVNQTIKNTKNGSIIIMHLSGVKNVSDTDVAVFSIIKTLKNKGFTFVTISQLIKDSPDNLN